MTLQVLHGNQAIAVPGTRRGEPLVRSIDQPQISHESQFGFSFAWVAANADVDAGDSVLTVKNTSDNFLVLTSLNGLPGNVSASYEIYRGNTSTALVGTTVTPVNLNGEFASKTFLHEAATDETAIADGTISDGLWISTVESNVLRLDGYILGRNDFIQINQETESTSGRVVLKGFFIPDLT